MQDPVEAIRAALAGRYRIDRRVGEGGMATVYLAYDERHGRQVAVKVLRPELAATIGLERFHREIQISARLNHPHILPLLDSGTLELGAGRVASAFYVMPFVEGESLRDRLQRDRKLPVAEALRLAREVADALSHAHRHGVIHRDIKPENVLLLEQHAVVADFGIARALDEAAAVPITQTGTSLGTPTYMSPEQITGEGVVDGRSDQYALACTLFEMLAGQPPWGSGSTTAVLARRLTEPPPRIRAVSPSVPAAVEAALVKALSREPEGRYATPSDFATALEAGDPARRGLGIGSRRRNALLAGAAVLVVIAFALTRLTGIGHADAITSLAIVPQSSQGMDSNVAYLAEGVQAEVADLLRRLPQLRVTAPSLVAQLGRQEPGLSYLQLGERLKVSAVMTWDLARVGDSVRVTAELLTIPSGDLLWSLRYARPYREIATIRGTVARMIADSLRLQLTRDEAATMARRPTTSGEAYAHYLRGHQFSLRGVPLGARDAQLLMDSAAHYGREALALDPDFAQAHGLMGTYYFVSALRGFRPFAAYMDSAMSFTRRALAVDSTLGDPYQLFISEAIYLKDDWPTAQAWRDRALRWNTHDAVTLQSVGLVTGEVEGRIDSAIVLLRRSVELEPASGNLNTLGDLYMRAGRYDSAASVLRRAVQLDPTVPGPRRRLIGSLERLGRYAEAIPVRREGGDSARAAAYAKAFQDAGAAGYERVRQADLARQVEALLADTGRPYRLPEDTVPLLRGERIAALYAQLGRWSEAMDWIEKEYAHRPRRFRLFVTNPLFRPLRGEPRFQALVRREALDVLLSR